MTTEKLVATIFDDSSFEAGMCSNGGHYRFFTQFTDTGAGLFRRTMGTSSEFGCCPHCGQYQGNEDHEELGFCSDVFVSLEEMRDEIQTALEDTSTCDFYEGEKALYVEFPEGVSP